MVNQHIRKMQGATSDGYRSQTTKTGSDLQRARTANMNFRSSGSLRIGTAVGQKVNNNMGGLFDVTAQQSPTRGTLFKSPSSGMPTFWHESIGP